MDSFINGLESPTEQFGRELCAMTDFIIHQMIQDKSGFLAAIDRAVIESKMVEAKKMKVVANCVYHLIGDCCRIPLYGGKCESETCKKAGCHKSRDAAQFLAKSSISDPDTFYSLFTGFADRINARKLMEGLDGDDWSGHEGQYLDMANLAKRIYEAQHNIEGIVYSDDNGRAARLARGTTA